MTSENSEHHSHPITDGSPQVMRNSDDDLREQVRDKLLGHGSVQASNIDVDVTDGTVTLSGTVSEKTMVQYAEDLVREIPEVTTVTNQLRFAENETTRDPLPH